MNKKIISVMLVFIFALTNIVGAAAKPVEVVRPEVKNIREVKVVNGKLKPYQTVRISSQITGIVEEVNYQVGDRVNKGDLLLTFENKDIKAQVKQAEAALAIVKASYRMTKNGATAEELAQVEAAYQQATASLEGAKSNLSLLESIYQDRTSQKQQLVSAEMQFKSASKQVEIAEEGLKQVQIGLEQAQTNLSQAQKEYDRISYLYNEGVATSREFETVENQLKNAKAGVDNARSALENAKIGKQQADVSLTGAEETYQLAMDNYKNPTQIEQQVENAKTQLKVAEANEKTAKANLDKVKKGARVEERDISKANVKQAEAALEQARLILDKTILESPIEGVISAVNFEAGEMVGAGSPIFTVVNDKQLYIEAGVNARTLIAVNPGDPARARVLALPDTYIEGEIAQVNPVIDPQTQDYRIKILINNDQGKLNAGMFVDLYLTTRTSGNALVLPTAAVLDVDTKPYVFVIKDDKAYKREIKLGIVNEHDLEILSGIEKTDKVIISGQNVINDGDSVEVIK